MPCHVGSVSTLRQAIQVNDQIVNINLSINNTKIANVSANRSIQSLYRGVDAVAQSNHCIGVWMQ